MFTGKYSITRANDPSKFTLEDTSDYTDEPEAGFTGRRIWLYKSDGTTLAPATQLVIVAGAKAKATITFPSVPADRNNIVIKTPASMAGVTLGYKVVNSGSDTSAAVMAANIESLANTGAVGTIAGGLVILNASLPTDGQSITVSLPDIAGGTALGTYVKQSSDTTVTILRNSILNALAMPTGWGKESYSTDSIGFTEPPELSSFINGARMKITTTFTNAPANAQFAGGVTPLVASTDYNITAASNVLTIEKDEESAMPNGKSLVLDFYTEPEVKAVAVLNIGTLVSQSNGTVFTILAQLPNNTYVGIGTYTKQADDVSNAVMGPRLVAAITGNSYGYTASFLGNNLSVTSFAGNGASQNTKQLSFSYSPSTTSATFSGGLDPIGLIPNTPTAFTGGVTPVNTNEYLAYIDFPYSMGDEIEISVLDKDYVLSVFMQWYPITPVVDSEYTSRNVYAFNKYTSQFLYYLTQVMSAKPSIINDTTFITKLFELQVWYDSSNRAALYKDVHAGQVALDKAKYIMDNKNLFF